ncbi:MAG: hypothetical protein MI919_00660, partial [Holophagales bacterium]|nr:hypothetical protein [Holophagales bacterium]
GLQLVMRDLVDVEGSGRLVTTIFSNNIFAVSAAVVRVPAGVEAELRELTVRSTSSSTGTGVSITSDEFLLTETRIEARTNGAAIGVQITNSSPVLDRVFVQLGSLGSNTGFAISGPKSAPAVTRSFAFIFSVGGTTNVGWKVDEGATPVLDEALAFVSGATENIATSILRGSNADLDNCRGTASGGEIARGLYLEKEARVDVKESTFQASSDSFAAAFELDNSFGFASDSTFRAGPTNAGHFAVFAVRLTGTSNLDSNQSNYDGSAFAAQNLGTGQARFGASQLIGSVFTSSITGLQCIFVYRGNYTARTATCT